MKLTKDCTRDFIDVAYFRNLMNILRYLTPTSIDITHGMLMFEDLSLRKDMQ